MVGPNVTLAGRFGRGVLVLLTLGAAVAACRARPAADAPDLEGERLEVVAVWEDAEAVSFGEVLDRFEVETGATVVFTSTEGEDVAKVLDERLDAGEPPDVAVLPQPALVARYAERGVIEPIDDLVGAQIEADWAPVWRRLGSVDGVLYGVWFKAAHKSLVWYSLRDFERAGIVPPADLDGLGDVARTLAEAGEPAFSLSGAASDAWTLTDWFENLYLRLAGPDRYDDLAAHRLAWTDPSVVETLQVMAGLLAPPLVTRVEGPDTTFPESVAAVFAPDARAAMVVEGDFVPGVVAGTTSAEVGVDVDVFPFPGRAAADRYVVGAGDAVVLLRDSPAARALVRYLASTEAAAVWAARGGFVSPNEALDLRAYPDAATRRIARSLLEAGDGFRFDLSDLQPVPFGGTTGAGMWAALSDFVADPTRPAATAARLEADATAAGAGR